MFFPETQSRKKSLHIHHSYIGTSLFLFICVRSIVFYLFGYGTTMVLGWPIIWLGSRGRFFVGAKARKDTIYTRIYVADLVFVVTLSCF